MANAFEGLSYITPLEIKSYERISRSETLNLKTQTVSNGAQRWELTVTLAPSNNKGTTAADKHGARLSVHRSMFGLHRPFTMKMPQHIGVTVSSSLDNNTLNGTTAAGTTNTNSVFGAHGIINMSLNSGTSTLPAGLFFKISTGDKIYQVIDEASLSTSNTAVKIFPPLVTAAASNTTIDIDPDITVYYAENGVEGVKYEGGIMTTATLEVIEAL